MKLLNIIPSSAQFDIFQAGHLGNAGIPVEFSHSAEGAEENQSLVSSGSSISNNSAFVSEFPQNQKDLKNLSSSSGSEINPAPAELPWIRWKMIFPLPIILSHQVLHNPPFPGAFPAFPSPQILLGPLIFPRGVVCASAEWEILFAAPIWERSSVIYRSPLMRKSQPGPSLPAASPGNPRGNGEEKCQAEI